MGALTLSGSVLTAYGVVFAVAVLVVARRAQLVIVMLAR
jgi:hypothetical protein